MSAFPARRRACAAGLALEESQIASKHVEMTENCSEPIAVSEFFVSDLC
jgi:hypothetical protein